MQPRRHSVVDITLTSILCVVATLAAIGTVGFSFLFVMATDSCNEHCAYGALNAAYAVTWGGVGIAVLIAVAGVIFAAVRGWLMWIWPAFALLLILIALGVGLHLADTVMHHV
jgi:cytochrome bd-type quinol oxidase subunit 2